MFQKHFKGISGALMVLVVLLTAATLVLSQDPGLQRMGSLELGEPGVSAGKLQIVNATSGTITVQPPTGALGTPTLTWPTATGTLVQRLGSVVTLTNVDLDTADNSIAAHVCEDLVLTATGLAATDNVVATMTSSDLAVTFNVLLHTPGTNAITARTCNNSAAAADPGAVADFRIIRLP